MSDPLDPVLYLVCNVRHHLDRLTEVIAPTFLLDDIGIHLTCGDIVITSQRNIEEPLVVAEVEIDFPPVV